jgi:hypothetical protein
VSGTPAYERVQVEWVDSVSHDGWDNHEAAVTRAATPGVLDCTSVGLLLANTDDYVLLCTTHMRDGDLVQGLLQIPQVAVREIKGLRK